MVPVRIFCLYSKNIASSMATVIDSAILFVRRAMTISVISGRKIIIL